MKEIPLPGDGGMRGGKRIEGSVDTREAYEAWSSTYDSDRNLTRDLDRAVIRSMLAGFRFASILEVGCGTGKNTAFLGRIGENVLGLDFAPAMIARARAKTAAPHIGYAVADISRPWPCPPGSFDLVTCSLVLEHVEDLSHVFAEASRVLKPAGRIFISELHPLRQDRGTQAEFVKEGSTVRIPAFVHQLSDFTGGAAGLGLSLLGVQEWRHDEDQNMGRLPRLVTLMFQKAVLNGP